MYIGGSSPRGSSSKPLKRGKACLTCRFLKIKCDGVRPICGPCERHPKDDPCEYADGPGRSRTKQLEDTVSRLEARLREYENPNETPAVTLSNPYEGSDSDSTLRVNLPPLPASRHPSEPSPHSTYSPSSSFSAPSPLSASSSTPSVGSSSSLRRVSVSPPHDHDIATQSLLDAFFTHASSFGFFLHVSRFYTAALQPSSFAFPTRPCRALFSTVLLWGTHLSNLTSHSRLQYSPTRSSQVQQAQVQEHDLLLCALRDTAVELVSSTVTEQHHPLLILQIIQAEVLLSYYFFHSGSIPEARRHAASAVSLALGSGLHRAWSGASRSSSHGSGAVEEGEKINGFWAVFTLYRNLSIAVDPPAEVCGVFDTPGMQVDTPWPLDMEGYKEGILPEPGSATVWNYLNHIQTRNDNTSSIHTLIAKASILLHQATFLEGQYHPDMSSRDSQAFAAAYQSLGHLIDGLRLQLPPLSDTSSLADATSPTTRLLFLAHSIIYGATIKHHGLFAYSDPNSRQVCVTAAKNMVYAGGINVREFVCVNPIMGTLWISACQVLTEELSRLRSLRSSGSPYHHSAAEESEQDIYSHLQLGLGAMSYFSTDSGMMSKFSLATRRWISDASGSIGPTDANHTKSGPWAKADEGIAMCSTSGLTSRPAYACGSALGVHFSTNIGDTSPTCSPSTSSTWSSICSPKCEPTRDDYGYSGQISTSSGLVGYV